MIPVPGLVVVLGLARQGAALARFFAEQGARVVVSDSRTRAELAETVAALEDLDVSYVLGEHPLTLLDGCELLCLSGGVPTDLPLVREARRRGIPLSNDAQEFLARCPAPTVGITGSAGKTTTTALVGRMLEDSGFRTWIGGNIGNPLINELPRIRATDRVVIELSSFQLELMQTSPAVAGVLNITPNHLDRHRTMAAYVAAKRAIVAHQGRGGIAVLGFDDVNARALSEATSAEVRYFSGQGDRFPGLGAFLHEDSRSDRRMLMLRTGSGDVEVVAREAVRLRGEHNVLNVLGGIALADAAGASLEGMRRAIETFEGVLHRLEVVRSLGGVLWVNDSIATAPERVLAALAAFDEPLVLLSGGRDKDLPWERYAERVVERVRVLVLFGEAASLIRDHVVKARGAGETVTLEEIVVVGTLEQALECASDRAVAGDVVLLSPGGTSFDAYRDFAERGEAFRAWVDQLSV